MSHTKWVQGSRRLAREKILQFLSAYKDNNIDFDLLFGHIFFRKFNLTDDKNQETARILTPEEIYELEADIPIHWNEDDIDFAKNIIHKVFDNEELFDKYIQKHTENWELDRIAYLDRTLMHIALTEIMFFNEIPFKVSVNEAIDIAKKYSTEKSSQFINGILDAIFIQLKEEKIITKNNVDPPEE